MATDIIKKGLTVITHFFLIEVYSILAKPKTLNLNLIKSLDVTANLKEIHGREKHVKLHHYDVDHQIHV